MRGDICSLLVCAILLDLGPRNNDALERLYNAFIDLLYNSIVPARSFIKLAMNTGIDDSLPLKSFTPHFVGPFLSYLLVMVVASSPVDYDSNNEYMCQGCDKNDGCQMLNFESLLASLRREAASRLWWKTGRVEGCD